MGQRSTGTRLERDRNERVTRQLVSLRLKLRKNEKKWQHCSISVKNKKAIHSPMFNHHSLITWGSFRGRQEEKWGSFRGRDHFGVNLGIISGLGIISWSGSFRGLYRPRNCSADYLRHTYGELYSRCKQAYLQEKHNIKRHLEKGGERLALH